MTDFTLHAGDYHATVAAEGATLVDLSYSGRQLLTNSAPYAGAVLAPWPNRIAGGRYQWRGKEHQAPINEPELGHAIHGMVATEQWSTSPHADATLSLDVHLSPRSGYDFNVSLNVRYELSKQGLRTVVTARNLGDGPAPFGCGFHPYVRPGKSPMEEWTLSIDADRYLETDETTKLPSHEADVAGTPFDYRLTQPVGTDSFSRAFRLKRNVHRIPSLTVRDPDGGAINVYADSTFRWIQVYRPDISLGVSGLAIEPMTCRPDAFNTAPQEVSLAAGATLHGSWSIDFSH